MCVMTFCGGVMVKQYISNENECTSEPDSTDVIDGNNIELSNAETEKAVPIEVASPKVSLTKVNQQFDASNTIKELGDVKYSKAIKVDGNSYNLYPTFEDLSQAVNNLKPKCKNIIDDMKNQYKLGEFTVASLPKYCENVYDYDQGLYDSMDTGNLDVETYQKKQDELLQFFEFIDIYENDACNKEIISEIKKLDLKSLDQNEKTEKELQELSSGINDLSLILPNNTGAQEVMKGIDSKLISEMPKLEKAAENGDVISLGVQAESNIVAVPCAYSGNSKFKIASGVSYADKYGANANRTKYSACTADCTNFASQIKAAGGVPRYKKYGQSNAWNYQVITMTAYPTLRYSNNWCNANSFCNFFGVKSKYTSKNYSNKYTRFVKFAAAVKKGNFIALDSAGDGSWNHVGFVSHTYHAGKSARTNISYHGTTYKDFKVSQHSKNYNRWVSDSANSWDTSSNGDSKIVFGIIN